MKDKLKPCPFCGKIPEVESELDSEGYAEVAIDHVCELDNGLISITLTDTNVYSLVNKWNTRFYD